MVISLEEQERTPCLCLLRRGKPFDEDVAHTVDVVVVLFGVQLNASSYIDVTIYLSLTVGCIVFHSQGVVSKV